MLVILQIQSPTSLNKYKSYLAKQNHIEQVVICYTIEQTNDILKKRLIDLVIVEIDIIEPKQLDYLTEIPVMYPDIKILIITTEILISLLQKVLTSSLFFFLFKKVNEQDWLLFFDEKQDTNKLTNNQTITLPFCNTNILSKRELEIVKLIIDGCTTREIASQLYIDWQTVKTHRRNILRKLNLKNTLELVKWYFGLG